MAGLLGMMALLAFALSPVATLFNGNGTDEDAETEPSVAPDGSDDLDAAPQAVLTGTDEGDLLQALADIDLVVGGDGDDTLAGVAVDSWVGSDLSQTTLDGGSGADRLEVTDHITATGGAGPDAFVLTPGFNASNTVTDFNPDEDQLVLDLAGQPEQPDVFLRDNNGDAQVLLDGDVVLDIAGAGVHLSADDILFENAEVVAEGTDADDTLAGGKGEDLLVGGDGDDVLRLGPDDIGRGGAGADIFQTRDGVPNTVTISDFEPGEDMVVIFYNSAEGTWPAPTLELNDTPAGDAILTSSQGLTVVLTGMSGKLSLDDVAVTDMPGEVGLPARLGSDPLAAMV